ncbi:hypothetical protein [Thiolapillus sp.]|uniref:hypothetical protein n=1 Tax=Thiolapillus sp. TaxID=2017437 RepID=UPI0025DEB627|nr:hypothetical protein [Thiolapillus sp.]
MIIRQDLALSKRLNQRDPPPRRHRLTGRQTICRALSQAKTAFDATRRLHNHGAVLPGV